MDSRTFPLCVFAYGLAILASVKHDKGISHKQMVFLLYEFFHVVSISIDLETPSHTQNNENLPCPQLVAFPAAPPNVIQLDPGTVLSPNKPQDLKALLDPQKNVPQVGVDSSCCLLMFGRLPLLHCPTTPREKKNNAVSNISSPVTAESVECKIT